MIAFRIIAALALATPISQHRRAALPGDTVATLLAQFRYDRQQPLEFRDSLERMDGDLAVHRLSFASPKGGRATGFLVVPPKSLTGPSGRFAGVVMLHGAPGDAAHTLPVAEYVARHGAVVLALDGPFARRDPNEPISLTAQDSVDAVQLMVDLQRAVDVLLARHDVDPKRLGYWGGSWGGANGLLFAAVERRVAAFTLFTADGGARMHFEQPDGSLPDPPEGVTRAELERWLAAMDAVSSRAYLGAIRPGTLALHWGRNDVLVPPRTAERVLAMIPQPQQVRWYASGHKMPPEARRDGLAFLVERLALAPVTPSDAQIPEVAPIAGSSGVALRAPRAPRAP